MVLGVKNELAAASCGTARLGGMLCYVAISV